MSEPWAFPQKSNDPDGQSTGSLPERVSVNDTATHDDSHAEPAALSEPIPQQTEQFQTQEPHTPVQPVEQFHQQPAPTDQFHQGPPHQPTAQFPQQGQFQQAAPVDQFQQHGQFPQQEQYQQPVHNYDAGSHMPQQQAGPKKKSGLLGLIGMLMVLAGNIVLAIAMSVNFSNVEFSEAFFESLARAQFGAAIFFILSAGLWVLGSFLCLIAVAARRGIIAGVIGLFIALVPSWFTALILVFASMGSTTLLYMVS